jgi:hypothetical protein
MNHKATRLILVLIGVVSIFGMQLSSVFSSQARDGSLAAAQNAQAVDTGEIIFLPTVLTNVPGTTAFGIDFGEITETNGLYKLANAGAGWIRRSAVNWSAVEPNEGERNWAALSELENELVTANSKGMKVILIVLSTPAWAQKADGYYCGPVKEEKLVSFANFMHDLVARYSVPPYNVKHWELWNEPDIAPVAVAQDSEFGCWGNADDPYYGGGYYAEMLKTTYPQVKAADPASQVLVGGLLLDCDPRLPGVVACPYKLPPKFLEGILRHNGDNDGGDFFDGVSFHAYDYYDYDLGKYASDKWNSDNTTGPVVIAKADYLNSLLNNPEFGAPGKFLMNTETALIYLGTPVTAEYEETKAYYVAQVYAAGQSLGLRASIWYNVFGWRSSGLLNKNLAERPAYKAYTVARQTLWDASFLGKIEDYPSILGFKFLRGDRPIWVIWSGDLQTHTVDLGSTPDWIIDALGEEVATSDSIQVGMKPLYLGWSP